VDANTAPRSNYVARATFAGREVNVLYRGDRTTSSGFSGICLDPHGKKLYWSDAVGDSEKGVWQANLEGSQAVRIYKSEKEGYISFLTIDYD
jgi:hypothetical protein